MASTFKYATQTDLGTIFPDYKSYLSRTQLFDFVGPAANIWSLSSIGGTPSAVFFDGVEGSKKTETPVGERDWYYTTDNDSLLIYTTTDPNDDQIVEAGYDKDTLVDQNLVNASMELSGMLDARYPRPLPKAKIGNSDTAEYDYLIIRATCIIYQKNALLTKGKTEEASAVMHELTNIDETGTLDKLNKGLYKLAFEIDDTEGGIIEVTKAGTMDLVQVYGKWSGANFERIQVIATVEGAYGTGKFVVKTSDGDQLYGTTSSAYTLTGGLQDIGNGLQIRFAGTSISVNDRWDIEVFNETLEPTNASLKSVELVR